MTSGVKPALPPMLVMKAGIEGKGARGRAPQPDFAEALGIGKQESGKKSAAMKADGGDPVAAWPRLGGKLGSVFERVHHAPLKPDVTNDEPDETLGDGLPGIDPGLDETLVERDAQHQNHLRPTALGDAPIVLPARQELSLRTERQPGAARDDKAPGIDPDVETKPSRARVTSDNAPADNAMSIDPASETPRVVSFTPLRATERTEPQQTQSVTRPRSTEGSSREGQASGGDSLPEATEPVRAAHRVTVVSQQNVPAPMASTALVLVDSIAGSTLLGGSSTVPSPNAIHAAATHASAQSLKIQLHPAELGLVTATLRFAGERLSIELKVENHEAYRQLNADSETIVGSLRDLGYDIDKVTILQPSIVNTAAARADAPTAMPAHAGRSGDQFNSAMSNGGGAGSGERSAGNGGKQEQGEQNGPQLRIETRESGLYI